MLPQCIGTFPCRQASVQMGVCRYMSVCVYIAGRTAQRRHCRLRHMDFLYVPARSLSPDATALYSPSGLISGFSGHPCPEIAVCTRNIKKISCSCAMTVSLFAQSAPKHGRLTCEPSIFTYMAAYAPSLITTALGALEGSPEASHVMPSPVRPFTVISVIA